MINFLQQFSLSPRTSQPISLRRVLLRTSLVLLAMYLLVGGRIDGLTIFPLYVVNMTLIIVGGFGWLIWRFWQRRRFPATPLDLPILAWLSVLLVTSLTSIDPRRSLDTFFYYLIFVLLYYFLVELERKYRGLEIWLSCILIASILTFGFSYQIIGDWYLKWLSIGGIEQPIPPANIRIDSIVGNATMLAVYLNLLWPLVLGRWLTTPSRPLKVLLTIWFVAALGLLYFTSSRGGWLAAALAAGLFTVLLVFDQRAAASRLFTWFRSHHFFSFGITLFGLIFAGLIGILLLRQVQHPSHPTGDPRGPIWSVAWEMFRQQPLLGTGPGTYPSAFLQTYSIPPVWLMPNAHNFILNMLAESGLLGAVTGLWLGLTVLWVAIRRWRAESRGKRTLLIGLLAMLVGLIVHSQFDLPQVIPVVNIITATVLARLVAPLQPEGQMRRSIGSTLLVAGWLTTAMFFIWSLWGYSALQRGMEVTFDGDLVTAASWMDEAVRRDPNLALYHFQSGQAHALLAFGDNGLVRDMKELGTALAAYEHGLQIDETFSLNWLSLGELRWANGDRAGGIAALEQAVSLAPGSPDLNLVLGMKYEEAGQMEPARDRYLKSLGLQPSLASSSFFQASDLRRQALSAFTSPTPTEGWLALEAGNYAQAEDYFRSQLGLNNSRAYLGLGKALLGQGNMDEAEQALRTAEFIDPKNFDAKVALADFYARAGQKELALSTLKTSRESNTWYDNEYGYYLSYHRLGLRNEFLLKMSCEFCFKPMNLAAAP